MAKTGFRRQIFRLAVDNRNEKMVKYEQIMYISPAFLESGLEMYIFYIVVSFR